MNPNDKWEALREDYLNQKFPGNLGDMVHKNGPCPRSNEPESASINLGRLAVAALLLIALGLGFLVSYPNSTETVQHLPSKLQPAKPPSPSDKPPTSAKSDLSADPLASKAAENNFFSKQMVLTAYRAKKFEPKVQNKASVNANPKPYRLMQFRKTNFWQSKPRQLAKTSTRGQQPPEARRKDNKKKETQPSQRRRWLKPRYEFKSITDPFYKYRRS